MVFLFCVDLCDLWACSPTCFFKRIERLGYSHRSPRFAQMRCVPYAKESVPISEDPSVRIGEITSLRSVGLRRVSCSLIKASRMAIQPSSFHILKRRSR